MTLYPTGYGDQLVTLNDLWARHTTGDDGTPMEPEYERRLFEWIEQQGGLIGIGDGWRPLGSDTSQASKDNKSFHQSQTFHDGTVWFCAVDLVAVNPGGVHRAPTWEEVPEQGSHWAAECLVHCNVNGEPWHMQPIEIDGYDSWVERGRPRPAPGHYPPAQEDDPMYLATLVDGTVCVVGSSVRPVSGEEIGPGGPYAGLPRWVPDPASYWHQWLRAAVDEYSRRVMG